MPDENMPPVKQTPNRIPRSSKERDRRLSSVVSARRRLNSPRGGGRAWINGDEVGGADPRYAHLATIND